MNPTLDREAVVETPNPLALAGIADVLRRMSRRARQPNPLAGGEVEFLADAAGFKADFECWYADAQAFAAAWRLPAEAGPG